jgi:hypothetical protein
MRKEKGKFSVDHRRMVFKEYRMMINGLNISTISIN